MLNQETAKAARTDSGYILRAPRRMRIADAVAQYMRVFLRNRPLLPLSNTSVYRKR
nr:MAG TPA: terminase large subunit [Caudoviricetes sp.]